MSKPYNVRDWYWVVGGDGTWVYSSKACDFVASDDETYREWNADGTTPTAIDTDFNLGGVLAPYLELRPIPQTVLDGYAEGRIQLMEAEPDYTLWLGTYGSRDKLMRAIRGE